jgi:hypothetical protein
VGYRDELIGRMQRDGIWTGFTGEQQAEFLAFSDEQAKQFLVLKDQWDMGDSKTVARMAGVSLGELIASFNGELIQIDCTDMPPLSKAGVLLAQFVQELRQNGLNEDEIACGFESLNALSIALLMTVYQKLTKGNQDQTPSG